MTPPVTPALVSVPDCGLIPLTDCPPGLFLFGECVGLKTEYGAMETVGPTDVPGSEVRWTVGNGPDAYVVASGEVFWGGAKTKSDRDAVLVQPLMLAAAPAVEGGVVNAAAAFQEAIDYFEADVADVLAEGSERADLWDREVTVNIDALKIVMSAALTTQPSGEGK